MKTRIESRGRLIYECSLEGETRKDDVYPAHPNGIPVSQNRWLIVYATRGWRCVDDDRSIVYQLREDRPDGKLIAEGMISASRDDWDPFGDGSAYVLQHGSPVAFGVPKGAVIYNKPAINANVFAIKWRMKAVGILNPVTNVIERDLQNQRRTQGVEWIQIALNDSEDDIEILQPKRSFRQTGYEEGEAFCKEATWMNQTFIQPVPYNRDCTEWVDVNSFDEGCIAPIKHRFNPKTMLYEWVETGEILGEVSWRQSEASIVRSGESWIICSRAEQKGTDKKATGWYRMEDPFGEISGPVFTTNPATPSPRTLYACADGVLRYFGGDPIFSPYGFGRNPLYCWDIDSDSLAPTSRKIVFDAITAGVLPEETIPTIDMCKLLPHGGGREQFFLHRVRTRNVSHTYTNLEEGAKVAKAYALPSIRDEWKEGQGIYYGVIRYPDEMEAAWEYE